ncbi:MAG: protein kinase [Bdellovibrionota bacterium]
MGDFGICKIEGQTQITRRDQLVGTPNYLAPEQILGDGVSAATDVFALGIVLWELLANDRLFVANNEINTLRKIRDCQIPSLRKINPNIPAELERIVSKALAKDRNMRYQTSAALHRDLSKFLNRQFPDFSPQDFSVFVKTLFASEILDSRRKMVEFSKFELPKVAAAAVAPAIAAPAPAPIQAAIEKVEVTSTETQNTRTEMEASDPSIDFGNAQHKAKPSFLNPDAPRAKVSAPKPAHSATPSQANQAPRPPAQAKTPQAVARKSETLSVERTNAGGFSAREHTMAGATRSQVRPLPENKSFISMFLNLVIAGCLLGGGAYYLANPKKATTQAYQALAQWGIYKQEVTQLQDQASETPRTKYVDVFISSTPSGAPIEIDGTPTGEVTPATLSLEKGKNVKITMRLASYLPSPFQEEFKVEGPRSIDAKFKSDKKGFLNVLVRGEGQIYINNRMVASTSPARMIAVPADENVTITVYDPKTKATDQAVTTVNEGATRTITLTPRAAETP